MSKNVTALQDFKKGLWDQNPIMKQVLGTCPTLAVTVSVVNGFAMGVATMFVLFFSSVMIALLKKLIPSQVRIAAYIVVIATFVTIVDIVMKAQFPALSKSLGPFIPLIVVNCIILGRAEAFASKNTVTRSMLDALGMGLGFTGALMFLGAVREILGSRMLLGYHVLPVSFEPILVMILPAGAFLTLGLMFGAIRFSEIRKKRKAREENLSQHLQAQMAAATPAAVTQQEGE
ncbi:MAG: electron transport complex subunit E [Ignavibacteriaceae bacterium]|nr:electron transport complex subunit E [Ignavibacteriaceae bacterium]